MEQEKQSKKGPTKYVQLNKRPPVPLKTDCQFCKAAGVHNPFATADTSCRHAKPGWMTVDNPFVYTGYRKTGDSVFNTIKTAFKLHNETFNIWSHAIPSACFLSRALALAWDKKRSFEERIGPMIVTSVAGYLCGVSAWAHLMSSMTEQTHTICFACDKASIPVFFWSCSMSSALLYFRNSKPRAVRKFWDAHIVLNTLSCICASTGGAMSSLGWRMSNTIKVLIICSQVFGGLVPAILEMAQTKNSVTRYLILKYASSAISCGVVGALFFIRFWPERDWPGRFDNLITSHGLMHVCVVYAMVLAIRGYTKVFRETFRK